MNRSRPLEKVDRKTSRCPQIVKRNSEKLKVNTPRPLPRRLRHERRPNWTTAELLVRILISTFRLPFSADRFDFQRQKIELITAKRVENDKVRATLFVPKLKEKALPKKFEAYRSERSSRGKKKPKNQALVDSIDAINPSVAESIWTDDPSRFPKPGARVWWEVWLRSGRAPNFLSIAARIGITISDVSIEFPNAQIFYASATVEQIELVFHSSDSLAELRAAQNAIDPWLGLSRADAIAAVQALATTLVATTADSPAVCILDTGVNRGHPLLAASLSPSDMHRVSGPTVTDYQGHGTGMAAIALLGDLNTALAHTSTPLSLTHKLESVVLLEQAAAFPTDPMKAPEFFALQIDRAIRLVEIQAAQRSRVACLATTLTNAAFETGRPTASSAIIDQLASEPLNQRLFCISAGNVGISAPRIPGRYETANDSNKIQDPAQSWNALTIGAYTDLVDINDPAHATSSALAPRGDLSPFSRTSMKWESQWACKPDVLFEGGNMVQPQTRGRCQSLIKI